MHSTPEYLLRGSYWAQGHDQFKWIVPLKLAKCMEYPYDAAYSTEMQESASHHFIAFAQLAANP